MIRSFFYRIGWKPKKGNCAPVLRVVSRRGWGGRGNSQSRLRAATIGSRSYLKVVQRTMEQSDTRTKASIIKINIPQMYKWAPKTNFSESRDADFPLHFISYMDSETIPLVWTNQHFLSPTSQLYYCRPNCSPLSISFYYYRRWAEIS